MEWLWSPVTLLAIGYVVLVAAWFARKLNRGQVVATEHGPDGHLEAIQFFWRPG